MPELGSSVTVGDMAPPELAKLVGHEILEVRTLVVVPNGFDIGFLLVTTCGSVVLVDLGDNLTVGDWSEQDRWRSLGVALSA